MWNDLFKNDQFHFDYLNWRDQQPNIGLNPEEDFTYDRQLRKQYLEQNGYATLSPNGEVTLTEKGTTLLASFAETSPPTGGTTTPPSTTDRSSIVIPSFTARPSEDVSDEQLASLYAYRLENWSSIPNLNELASTTQLVGRNAPNAHVTFYVEDYRGKSGEGVLNTIGGARRFQLVQSDWDKIVRAVSFGGVDKANIQIPDPEVTDYFHEKGIPYLGNIHIHHAWFEQDRSRASGSLFTSGGLRHLDYLGRDYNQQNAEHLVNLARRLNFDGWHLNNEGTPAEIQFEIKAFIAAFHSYDKANYPTKRPLEFITYLANNYSAPAVESDGEGYNSIFIQQSVSDEELTRRLRNISP